MQFDVFLTTDQNLRHQQNLKGRAIAIVIMVAPNTRFDTLAALMPQVEAVLPTIRAGEVLEIQY